MGSHDSFTNCPYGFFFSFFLLLLFFCNLIILLGQRELEMTSIVFSSKHVSLWQRKEIAYCLNSCSVNFLITFLTLCMFLDSLIIVYHHILRFCQPSYRTKSYGSRAFSVSAPCLWNKLPMCSPSTAIFKRKLKTHLFKLAYY